MRSSAVEPKRGSDPVGKHVENRTILICAAMMRAMKQTRMSNSYLFYLFYYYTIQASLTVHQCAVPLNTTIGSREIKKNAKDFNWYTLQKGDRE
jgi:hypothetical protein